VTATTTHDNPTWRTDGYWATVTAATVFIDNRSVAVPSVIRLGLAADRVLLLAAMPPIPGPLTLQLRGQRLLPIRL